MVTAITAAVIASITSIAAAVLGVAGNRLVERRRRSLDKDERHQAVAVLLLRSLRDLESYFVDMPGSPNTASVHGLQSGVRTAAQDYGDAARALRRVRIVRRQQLQQIDDILLAALAAYQAEWDNFDHSPIEALAREAIYKLLQAHPELRVEVDRDAVRALLDPSRLRDRHRRALPPGG